MEAYARRVPNDDLTPDSIAGSLLGVSLAALQVQVLGPLSVLRDGEPVRLPQSKKTRGLLAYLAITGRAHRRDRLCSLLWDVADDPRGALRWSLSKIRPVVDTDGTRCLIADRESVELKLEKARLDWRWARHELASGLDSLPTERLKKLESAFEGELLEGLDLSGFDEFTAWCAAEREHARKLHVEVLRALVGRFESAAIDAIPYSRELVRIDPVDEDARAELIRLLARAGRRNEAKAQYESAARMLKELGAKLTGPLETAWREVNRREDASSDEHLPSATETTGAAGPTGPGASPSPRSPRRVRRS